VAVSADGRTAVSGAEDDTVRVWDLDAGQCRATLEGHTNRVLGVAVSADGQTAVSGAEDHTVRVWDLASGQCRAVHPEDSEEALQAWATVRTDRRFAVEWDLHFLALYSLADQSVVARFPGQFEKAGPLTGQFRRAIRFPYLFEKAGCSPDGRHVVAGDARGGVYLLRLHTRTG
jgi:hypothetical protein